MDDNDLQEPSFECWVTEHSHDYSKPFNEYKYASEEYYNDQDNYQDPDDNGYYSYSYEDDE